MISIPAVVAIILAVVTLLLAQPRGHRTFWHGKHFWQLHLTPIHLHRYGNQWEAGLCLGKRTIYLKRHK